MSCSKPLPPFTYDVLCSLNRDQLERLSIVCRPLKNFIERYFHSKPYRMFVLLEIRGGSYALIHKEVQWHPSRQDYSVQQFLDGQKCSTDPREDGNFWIDDCTYYSFTEMLPYLGPNVRTKTTQISINKDFTYNPEHIAEMESLAYLWSDGKIEIDNNDGPTVAEDILPILNSPTILQCRVLDMFDAHFSFKDYKVLFTVKVIIETCYYRNNMLDPIFWLEFLEQPGVKPVIALHHLHRDGIDSLLELLFKVFSSAVSPNAFKLVFSIYPFGRFNEPLTEFRETNKTSGEILELKKGLSTDYPNDYPNEWFNDQLEQFSIVCRPLKNFIDRYFRSKPYRIFDRLEIRRGLYALEHKRVQWHPNRDGYSTQQFLAGQKWKSGKHWEDRVYYSFAEILPYLGPTIRIENARIYIDEDFTYNPEHVAQLESIEYLWRDGYLNICNAREDDIQLVAEYFQPILNSPIILQCQNLSMDNAHFSFKDYKVLFTVKVFEIDYYNYETYPEYCLQFLEQPGVKPVVVLACVHRKSIDSILEHLFKAFSSAVSPNAFKIVFVKPRGNQKHLTEFRETNKTSGEILELKEGLPTELNLEIYYDVGINYTLERSKQMLLS